MNKLIKSELFRIKNSNILLSSIIIIFIITIFLCITQYNYIKTGSAEVSYDIIWFFSAFIGFFTAIFTSLHVGSDFSDRTINYKIISGYSKSKIYLSYLITCIIEGLICLFTYMFIIFVFGLFFLNPSSLSTIEILKLSIEVILLTISLTSLFTLLAVLFADKTLTVVISTIIVFGLSVLSFLMLEHLKESEYINQTIISDNGPVLEITKNPKYLTGAKRKVYEVTNDILPSSIAWRISDLSIIDRNNAIYYMIIFTFICNLIGINILSKKQLR